MPLRDNLLECPYHLEGLYHDPSSLHTHDASQSTDEDFDFEYFVNFEPEHQPTRMDQSNSGIDVSRSETLERGPLPSQQENKRQSPTPQPDSSAPPSPLNNGVLDKMQIDNEQKENEQEGNENAGSGDVFEALSSIRRVRTQVSHTSPRDFERSKRLSRNGWMIKCRPPKSPCFRLRHGCGSLG